MKDNKNDENYIYYVIGQNLKKLRKDKVFQTISIGSLYHLAKILGIDIRELFAPIDENM